MTSYIDSEGIQSGWKVWTSDGEELGTVTAVEEVETGRVELNITKSEAEAQSA
jgi:hypothetical protein